MLKGYIGWTHADLQSDPSDVFKAFKICDKYSESPLLFAKGRRRKRKIVDRIFSRGMSIFEPSSFLASMMTSMLSPIFFLELFIKKHYTQDFSDLYFCILAKS